MKQSEGGKMRTLKLLVLLWLLPFAAHAEIFDCSTNDDNTLTITNYTGPNGTVIVPPVINGLTVAVIGDYAFNLRTVTNIIVSDGISSLGNHAFYDLDS